jgi:hypothetical protein
MKGKIGNSGVKKKRGGAGREKIMNHYLVPLGLAVNIFLIVQKIFGS